MKRILIVSNLLFAGIIFLQCCKTVATTPPPVKICERTPELGLPTTPLQDLISFEDARAMVAAYVADSGKKYVWQGDRATNMLDAKSIWFDLKKLKKYIEFIEYQVCKSSCDTGKALGIRFYYAKYPDAARTNAMGVAPGYANRHTLFLVPTYWENRRNNDFDPWRLNADTCRLQPLNATGGNVRRAFARMTDETGNPDKQNHGSIIPPENAAGTAF